MAESEFIMSTYRRFPVQLVRGQGVWVWDSDGNEYLDFLAGIAVNGLGHCHPSVVKAICDQASKLIHTSNLYYTQPQIDLARMLVELAGGGKVFFCNSGAEAIEGAIKLARKWGTVKLNVTEKYEVVCAENSLHGRTFGALSATGQTKYHKGFKPLLPGFKYVRFNDVDDLERAVTDKTCAVILEAVQGEGGIVPATRLFVQRAKELCQANDALLIMDEIQCGMGRTGKFFGYQHFDIEPDVIAVAKSLGGGLPIGAIIAKGKAATVFEPGDHASTFGGNPLACAAAIAVLETIRAEDLIVNAQVQGARLKSLLHAVAARWNCVKEVRGLGLMVGVDLSFPGTAVVQEALKRGLLLNCTADTVVRFLPPLTVNEAHVKLAVDKFEDALKAAFASTSS